MIIQRLCARACLAEPGSELQRARREAAAGDADWQQWVEEYDSGEATLIDLAVSVQLELDDGSPQTLVTRNHQVWVDLDQHPPVVERLIAELATKDHVDFAAQIRELGGEVTAEGLAGMHVAVDLTPDLRRALRPPWPLIAVSHDGARAGGETENAERS